jgi:hypothetical protein
MYENFVILVLESLPALVVVPAGYTEREGNETKFETLTDVGAVFFI